MVGCRSTNSPIGRAPKNAGLWARHPDLPDSAELYLCHDYPPEGREAQCVTTVAAEKTGNVHVHSGVSEAEFVAMRTARDATLSMPVLLLPSVQVNMRAGQLPPPEDNGIRYLKLPLNAV